MLVKYVRLSNIVLYDLNMHRIACEKTIGPCTPQIVGMQGRQSVSKHANSPVVKDLEGR